MSNLDHFMDELERRIQGITKQAEAVYFSAASGTHEEEQAAALLDQAYGLSLWVKENAVAVRGIQSLTPQEFLGQLSAMIAQEQEDAKWPTSGGESRHTLH